MVMLTRGPNAGEYVACCALSRCGYLGKLSSESGWIGCARIVIMQDRLGHQVGNRIVTLAKRAELYKNWS